MPYLSAMELVRSNTPFSYFNPLRTCYQMPIPSFAIAVFHAAGLESSSEAPTISKPLSLYFAYNSFKCGLFFRHGTHQLAQKSRRTYLPFKSTRLNCSPLNSFDANEN